MEDFRHGDEGSEGDEQADGGSDWRGDIGHESEVEFDACSVDDDTLDEKVTWVGVNYGSLGGMRDLLKDLLPK